MFEAWGRDLDADAVLPRLFVGSVCENLDALKDHGNNFATCPVPVVGLLAVSFDFPAIFAISPVLRQAKVSPIS